MSDPASDDPFEVIGEIPSGLAYQWCVLAVMGDSTLGGNCIEAYKRDGWGPVPRKRHPRMRHQGHWIIVHDCLLIQKPKRLVEATQAEDIAIARQQMDDARAMYGFPPTQDDRPRIGFEVGLLSQPVAGLP